MSNVWRPAAALTLALAAVSACSVPARPDSGGNATPETPPAAEVQIRIPVQVAYPETGDISDYIETFTRVEAETQVEVTSQGVGECYAVFAEEGDRVEKGFVLAELDKAEAQATLDQARVQVQQRRVEYERAKEGAPVFVPQAELDAAGFAYEQARANLRMQELQLDNMTIRAPFTGIIARRDIQPGMLVTSGRPVFRIVDPESLVLAISVEESRLSQIRVGQAAQVTFDALAGSVFEARVRRINPTVEQGAAKVLLDLSGEDRHVLKEGLFARVRLVVDVHEGALLIAKDALVEESGRRYVYTVAKAEAEEGAQSADDIARRIEVRTGYEDSTRIEILAGIDATTPIVVLGQQTLKPDTPVRVMDSGTPQTNTGAEQ